MNRGYTKAIALDVKAIGEDGSFEGYAAKFGNIDLGGDIIVKGAFTDWLADIKATKSKLPPVLWQHDMSSPIGKTLEIYEDDNGLYVKGQLSTTQLAMDARTLAKDEVLQGMSIGYWIKDYARDQESGAYLLKTLKPFEYSFVTLPMNTEAVFTSIKSLEALESLETVRDCETYLRDVGGMSSKQAKRFISIIKNGRDDQDDKDQELASKLKQLAQRMEVNK